MNRWVFLSNRLCGRFCSLDFDITISTNNEGVKNKSWRVGHVREAEINLLPLIAYIHHPLLNSPEDLDTYTH